MLKIKLKKVFIDEDYYGHIFKCKNVYMKIFDGIIEDEIYFFFFDSIKNPAYIKEFKKIINK